MSLLLSHTTPLRPASITPELRRLDSIPLDSIMAEVSILTRSEERVRRVSCSVLRPPNHVSILTRSEERVRQSIIFTFSSAEKRFNPHPLRRAGATVFFTDYCIAQHVSILTRSEERVRRFQQLLHQSRLPCFNPHPLRRAGATSTLCHAIQHLACFNPHPLRRAGATKGNSRK